MATPRKHWFKVADSIGDEDWDNDVLATLIRLQARLNTKWARNGLVGEEAGRITLTAGDAMAVTRRSSFARALALLRRCTQAVSMLLHESRAAVKIEWAKWPEFQGLPCRELPESRPLRDSDSDAPARRKTEKRTETPAAFALTPDPVDPSDPTPLLNLIANQDGERDEKAAWLEAEWPLIQAEAEAEGNPKRVKPIAIRFYRNYLKSDRRFRNWAAKQETRRRVAEHEAKFAGVIEEIEREEGYAAAHR